MLHADAGHIADDARDGRHPAQADKGVGDDVVTHSPHVEVAGLFPEAVDIRAGSLAHRLPLEHNRKGPLEWHESLIDGFRLLFQHLFGNLIKLVVASADHAEVVLDDTRALASELGLKLVLDGFEKLFFRESGVLHDRGGLEERALEGDTLHAEHELGIGGFLSGDLESVDEPHLDVVVPDGFLVLGGNVGPDRFG